MTVGIVDELIDANECGVAIEIMSERLVESGAVISAETLSDVSLLVEEMGLDQVKVERLRSRGAVKYAGPVTNHDPTCQPIRRDARHIHAPPILCALTTVTKPSARSSPPVPDPLPAPASINGELLMPRQRKYSSNAERRAAYRARLAQRQATAVDRHLAARVAELETALAATTRRAETAETRSTQAEQEANITRERIEVWRSAWPAPGRQPGVRRQVGGGHEPPGPPPS